MRGLLFVGQALHRDQGRGMVLHQDWGRGGHGRILRISHGWTAIGGWNGLRARDGYNGRGGSGPDSLPPAPPPPPW